MKKSEEGSKLLPNPCKLQLLSKLLYSANTNNLLTMKHEVLRYLALCSKTKKKGPTQALDAIMVSARLSESLSKLSELLLEVIKESAGPAL
jgi:hypothetical protein